MYTEGLCDLPSQGVNGRTGMSLGTTHATESPGPALQWRRRTTDLLRWDVSVLGVFPSESENRLISLLKSRYTYSPTWPASCPASLLLHFFLFCWIPLGKKGSGPWEGHLLWSVWSLGRQWVRAEPKAYDRKKMNFQQAYNDWCTDWTPTMCWVPSLMWALSHLILHLQEYQSPPRIILCDCQH